MSKTPIGSALIVVLNFNGWKETIPCIEAVLAQSYSKFHILLIDNGSKDESLNKLTQFDNHERITFHKEPVNLGFAGGVNVGIRKAIKEDYEYTVLLNNDAIITKDWLKILINSMQTTAASVATGLLLESSGKKIESTGDSYSSYGLPYPRQRDEITEAALESSFVFGGTAGASVYKTSLFKKLVFLTKSFLLIMKIQTSATAPSLLATQLIMKRRLLHITIMEQPVVKFPALLYIKLSRTFRYFYGKMYRLDYFQVPH